MRSAQNEIICTFKRFVDEKKCMNFVFAEEKQFFGGWYVVIDTTEHDRDMNL